MPIGEEPHFHYFNQNLQISIRPARSHGQFDPYAPGLHHICLQVESRIEVEKSARLLKGIGVETSSPAFFPEYAEDYYAIFFQDPDGILFEIVSRREDRRLIATHWNKLEGFVNPLRKLKARLQSEEN